MYTKDDLAKLSDEDKKRQIHSIQMQIIILESDNRKILQEKNALEAELRQLKVKEERIKVESAEKKKKSEGLEFTLTQNEAELKNLKKKLNLL